MTVYDIGSLTAKKIGWALLLNCLQSPFYTNQIIRNMYMEVMLHAFKIKDRVIGYAVSMAVAGILKIVVGFLFKA